MLSLSPPRPGVRADPAAYKRRLKSGGNKKEQFTEGWVEFGSKADAKNVAALLNNTPVGAWVCKALCGGGRVCGCAAYSRDLAHIHCSPHYHACVVLQSPRAAGAASTRRTGGT